MATATFVSRDQNLRLVNKPKRRLLNQDSGEAYTTEGSRVEFSGGQYVTEDKDEIKFLRDHEQNGNLFVEKGKEPDRVLPETGDLLKQIVQATADKDGDKLAQIYLSESTTHSRPEVLQAASAGLEAVGEDQPDPPPTPAHELTRVRVTGPAQPGAVDTAPAPQQPGSGAVDTAPAEEKPKRSAKK